MGTESRELSRPTEPGPPSPPRPFPGGHTALRPAPSVTAAPDAPLCPTPFKHQGTITVNEEGTQAAAVTAVGFMPLSTQVRFSVDRPFLFLIYEHRTSCLLFLGRVANPARP